MTSVHGVYESSQGGEGVSLILINLCFIYATGPQVLQLEDFMNWFGKIPQEKLKEALDFQILHIDEESSQ